MSPSGAGGVTTVVMGNCGVGAAPTRREGREFMMNILGVVEDIPVEVMREGVQWEVGGEAWESCAFSLSLSLSLSLSIYLSLSLFHTHTRGCLSH